MGCGASTASVANEASPQLRAADRNVERSAQPPTPRQSKIRTYNAVQADGYELVKVLGDGTGSERNQLLRNRKTNEVVSAKSVGTSKEGVPRGIEREIVNHRGLVHPNIVRFYEVFSFEDTLTIVSEYPSDGCLADKLAQDGPVTEDQAKALFLQLLAGMQYCHEKQVWHRDLRVENLYLDLSDAQSCLKISGFGYSKSAVYDSDPRTKNLTAPLNTPPEQLLGTGNQQAKYDGSKLDIWGAGIILYVMLTGLQPFEDPENPKVMNRIAMNKIVNCSFSFPAGIQLSRECKDFISKIFVAKPQDRPTLSEMQSMPWLTGQKTPQETVSLVESKQTTTEIAEVVERARRRREVRAPNSQGRSGPNSNGSLQGGVTVQYGPRSAGSKRSLLDTHSREIDGIAEYKNRSDPPPLPRI